MADNNVLLNTDGQVLPFSLDAEQAVLGAVLIDPACIDKVATTLKPDHFYLPQHKAIYSIMWNMNSMNKAVDAVTVLEELKSQGIYDDAGGKSYLMQLAQMVPTAANIETYADLIVQKSNVRSLIEAARDIINQASTDEVEVPMLMDYAEQRIYSIRQGQQFSGLKHIKEVITGETFERLEKLNNEETRDEFIGIPTGFSSIDYFISGLHKSDLVILGARPAMGKTSMALNIARNVAVNAKKTVCIFSLEMTREQLAERLICNEASIKSEKMRNGKLEESDWMRFSEATSVLGQASIYLDETSGITVPEIMAKLRRLPKVDLVMIDYLGLMHSAERKENRVQEIGDISRNLKVLAKELNVPVVCCAQLRRESAEQRAKSGSHRPQLSDLRDSGSIEQDADIVMFLHREGYYVDDKSNPGEVDMNAAECIIAKNRHGEVGTAKLRWDGQYTRFTSEYRTNEQ